MIRRLPFGLAAILLAAAVFRADAADLEAQGRAAYSRGEFSHAEQLFTEALRERPRDAALHYQRAVALTRLGRVTEAAEAYRVALRFDPSPEVAAAAREGLRRVTAIPESRRAPATSSDDEIAVKRRPRTVHEDEVPLRRARGGWFADVTLHDGRTATFLVDTGASICVISPELAAATGIEPPPNAQVVVLQTLSGRTAGHMVTLPSLRVGEAEARDVKAIVHEIPGMDGILGNTFLARFVATVDPERSVLRLRPR
jgi:clan AA aspartic protease (TIGR02281 family)